MGVPHLGRGAGVLLQNIHQKQRRPHAPPHAPANMDLDYDELTQTLADNFNILADEVQLLSDRKTILEHKLRFAHEQVRAFAS
jgi:hypothetical protein